MKLSPHEAREAAEHVKALAYRLRTIPQGPQSNVDVELLADDLFEHCDSEDEAEWLVAEARRRWTRWQGLAGLLALLSARHVEQRAAAGPMVRCRKCMDLGYVVVSGVTSWCDGGAAGSLCFVARTIRANDPEFVRRSNLPREEARPIRISEAARLKRVPDVERVNQRGVRQARTPEQEKRAIEGMVAHAQSVIADPDASASEREVALATLQVFGRRPAERRRAVEDEGYGDDFRPSCEEEFAEREAS